MLSTGMRLAPEAKHLKINAGSGGRSFEERALRFGERSLELKALRNGIWSQRSSVREQTN